jgi:hypothetical protein
MPTLAEMLRQGSFENPNNPYSSNLLADALRGSLSNAESLGRGAAVAPLGIFGDVNALAREYITPRLPAKVQAALESLPAAPTTEAILAQIPRGTAARRESSGMEQLGAAMNPMGPVEAAKGVTKGLGAYGKLAGEAINDAMVYGRGPLAEVTPQAMRIVPVDVAKRIDMPVNLPQSKEFLKAIENEPSAKITDEGLLMNLKRMQTPEQSGMESVRTGVFYLPEGQAANLKHYKGKTGYGGAESIEGETLYKNPLFVKGATGGKAPEAAYDQLVGKGAYQAMRDDVLKSYGYNSNHSQKVEAVQGLLEKYNGLDADDAYNMAYNIVSNSKNGNTLPYAIQENIVGNAVRNAGHDAVLGYGKGRGDKGEFLSEVFDVRESHYPTPQGEYDLMPQFQGAYK